MTNGPFHLSPGLMATTGDASPDALTAIVNAATEASTLPAREAATEVGDDGYQGPTIRDGMASVDFVDSSGDAPDTTLLGGSSRTAPAASHGTTRRRPPTLSPVAAVAPASGGSITPPGRLDVDMKRLHREPTEAALQGFSSVQRFA